LSMVTTSSGMAAMLAAGLQLALVP
jgi:hypothetical protein